MNRLPLAFIPGAIFLVMGLFLYVSAYENNSLQRDDGIEVVTNLDGSKTYKAYIEDGISSKSEISKQIQIQLDDNVISDSQAELER
jgi:hypothetical protein